PRVATVKGLPLLEIPKEVAQILVGQEIVALEGVDDGRLDALSQRFTAMAGAAIAPAHPRTKVLDKLPRTVVALGSDWHVREQLDRDELQRLQREQIDELTLKTWPKTPLPYLGGRTPLAAAAAGNAEVPLRAAVMHYEASSVSWPHAFDFAALRGTLRIP